MSDEDSFTNTAMHSAKMECIAFLLPRGLMSRLCAVLFFSAAVTWGGELYFTDFESFPVGDNKWAGTDGWLSNDTTSGAQGIVEDFVSNLPLGRTAYLGFNPPAGAFTTVSRAVNHDPVASQIPVVGFDSLLGIQDSTNGRRDRFYISFYNISGNFLAAICFDNTLQRVFRDDGVAISNTGIEFIRGDQIFGFVSLQLLDVRIDLAENKWSAWLDGVPLFQKATFTSTGRTRDLGPVAAEWEVVIKEPTLAAGDNWLFVADWRVRSIPQGIEPFELSFFERAADGSFTLTWPGQAGFDYHVLYSDDLVGWHDDLPGAEFPAVMSDGELSFTDEGAPPGRRFYRVARNPSP